MATIITHDLTDIEKAFRSALLADAEFAAMLGSNIEVWRGQPRTKVALPSVIIQITNHNPVFGDNFTGVWRPEWQIDVLGDGPGPARHIHAYLEQAWTMPQAHADAVKSQWLDMTEFRPFSSLIEVGEVMLQSSQQAAYVTSRLYRSRVLVAREP